MTATLLLEGLNATTLASLFSTLASGGCIDTANGETLVAAGGVTMRVVPLSAANTTAANTTTLNTPLGTYTVGVGATGLCVIDYPFYADGSWRVTAAYEVAPLLEDTGYTENALIVVRVAYPCANLTATPPPVLGG